MAEAELRVQITILILFGRALRLSQFRSPPDSGSSSPRFMDTQDGAKNNKRYTKYSTGSWYYTYIRSADDIDDELMDIIVTTSHKGEQFG